MAQKTRLSFLRLRFIIARDPLYRPPPSGGHWGRRVAQAEVATTILLLLLLLLLLAAQHVQQVVFTHRLGQRQASVLAARVVDVRLVKMKIQYTLLYQPREPAARESATCHPCRIPDQTKNETTKTHTHNEK
jgi:hypothetical protein